MTPPTRNWRERRFFGRPWQDLVFSVAEVVFLITLIPLLIDDVDVPVLTGVGTAFMLYVLALCQLSYRNWIALGLTLLTATLWLLTPFV